LLLSVTVLLISQGSGYDKEALISNITSSSTKTMDDLTYQVLYYQELMKNYTLGFYNDHDTEGQKGSSKFHELLTPAFSETIPQKQVLADNIELMKQVLMKPISEPRLKLVKISESEDQSNYQLENATFVSLVRNSELNQIRDSIAQIEETFNEKYHYPYVFLNDEPFTDDFKQSIKKVTKSECFFEQIDPKTWDKPDFIDLKKEQKGIEYLKSKGVGYSDLESYHNMCRYYSKGFYNHPTMKKYRYYWRIEPSTKYFCDIEYDVFKFMKDNDKIYGYVLNLYDSPDSVKSLWPATIEFLLENPHYLHDNSATTYLRENLQNPDNYRIANGYSTCHFWSNFEIGDMDFYRGEAYTKWVEYLDSKGGFYYERWGDAPVHSIGLSLFADKSKIHWFRDIGYEHMPYYNCPVSDKCRKRCKKGAFSNFKQLNNQNCQPTWIKYEMTEEQLNDY
jgi:mannosyltransferase